MSPRYRGRSFRGLRETPPADSYDAVIIGAGIGGLVLANLLVREGLSVLLAERHYMVGGYCSTFKRRGYVFDASSHFYPLLGNPHTLTGRLLEELEIPTDWVKMDPVDTFHFPDGSRFAVPADLDAYLAKVKAEIPAEAAALDAFFEKVQSAYLLGLLAYFRDRETARFAELAPLTVRQALDRHFESDKLKLLLTADCPHWGSPPERTSFVFDSMLRLSYFLGNYYPVGGSQAFADDLAARFEEQGGHIAMSTAARRLEVAEGRVQAVELETVRGSRQGRFRVTAGTVISNADLRWTMEDLVGSQHFPAAYRQWVHRLRPSFSCFLTHVGLTGVEPELLDRVQGYYWNRWDPDEVGRNGLRCKIFVPTLYEPGLAPPGGQVVVLQKVLDLDYSAVEDWRRHKAQVERYVLEHLERVIPGVGEKIVTVTSATARTAERFTSNTEGAMLGWEMSPQQLGEGRPDTATPVGGLYLVGHWTRPGGGITPVVVSAVRVAEAITGRRVALAMGAMDVTPAGAANRGASVRG